MWWRFAPYFELASFAVGVCLIGFGYGDWFLASGIGCLAWFSRSAS